MTTTPGRLTLTIITGLISNEAVVLDETHFQDCTLEGCTLHYNGGAVIFESTLIKHCNYVFGDNAKRTVDLLRVLGLLCETFSAELSEDALAN